MIPGQLIASGQLTDPGVNIASGQLTDPGVNIASGQLTDPGVSIASVHGLTSVTVHMNFSLPRGNFERQVTRCTTPGKRPCQGDFSPCEQNAKVAPGQGKSSLAHPHY